MEHDRALSEAMRAELTVVLASPAFARSPVLSRLLAYLVEESVAGRAGRLKSYTVAVDGMGREAAHDPQLDTYSRVAMVRLRRALDTFYQEDTRRPARRLFIPFGSYEVVLEEQAAAVPGPVRAPMPAARFAAPLRRFRWPILLVLLALALLAGQWWHANSLRERAVWQQSNFPSVLVTVDGSAAPPATFEKSEMADYIRESIRPYETIQLAQAMSSEVSYVVDLRLEDAEAGGRILEIHVTNLRRNRVIYEAEIPVANPGRPDEASRLALNRAIYAVFGYAGQIEMLEARNSFAPDTPYECWLRFSQQVRLEPLFVDPDTSDCAANWHQHAPQRPMAVFIYAWTQVNDALGSLTAGTRDRKLRETLQLLEAARARYPGSRHIQLVLARTYAFLGYKDSVRKTVQGLRSADRPNPDLTNVAGTFMILQNDLSGEALVDEAIAFHPDPPPRYFLGKFIAAMVRDDVPGAGTALQSIVVENRSSIWGQVFQAAYLARAGDIPAAKAAWQIVTDQRPALGLSPRLFISASPAAPEIESRLLEWLGPVID